MMTSITIHVHYGSRTEHDWWTNEAKGLWVVPSSSVDDGRDREEWESYQKAIPIAYIEIFTKRLSPSHDNSPKI